MKFPLSWLKTFLPTKLPPQEIADKLTQLGFEVESVDAFGIHFSGVVVGEVLETKPHPDADKLCVAVVSDGTANFQVVCGAPNCRKGLRTAFAKVGARVGAIDILERKVRGVESAGMLCAADELNLAKEADGIMELDESFVIGRPLGCYFGDLVFEVALTPNLAYAAHITGIAQELGAFIQEKVELPSYTVEVKGKKKVSVKSCCPRYGCRIIEKVQVGPSPDWMVKRLEACGLRSINNIVDVTNYVMLERGQPLHAFDLDTLEGGIAVRPAKKGETIQTLDEKKHALSEEIEVVADDKKALAIAGVMGSLESQVTEKTENILLEAAYFEPKKVRRTAKALDLTTDASYRFERGTDPNCLEEILDEAAALICEVAGGTVSPTVVKGEPFPDKKLICRPERVNQLLGTQLAVSEVETILRRIGLHVKGETVHVPAKRHDLNAEIDLIEEVARFFGYANIATKRPTLYRGGKGHAPVHTLQQRVRDFLLQEGLQELLTCDLISPKEAAILEQSTLIHLRNPHSQEQSILRPSLLPSLLKVVQHNEDHGNENLAGFEIGKLHLRVKDAYFEPVVASIVLHGRRQPHHWSGNKQPFDFFDIKGIVENLLNHLRVDYCFEKSQHPTLHPGRQASIVVDNKSIGILGEVHPKFGDAVYFAELYLEELKEGTKRMRPLPQYPSSSRDLTVTVPTHITAQQLFDVAQKAQANFLEEISLIDVYRDEKLGSDVKNMTFRFIYRDNEKTLSVEEVEEAHAKLTNTMKNLELG